MVTRASRFPVLVDPQGQGRAWLCAREAPNGLLVTQLTDKNFRNHLEVDSSHATPAQCSNLVRRLQDSTSQSTSPTFILAFGIT